jgi:chromodomain-helicase-DNA-binding protein 7
VAAEKTVRRRPDRDVRKSKMATHDSSDSESAASDDSDSCTESNHESFQKDRGGRSAPDWEAVEPQAIDTGVSIQKPKSAYQFYTKGAFGGFNKEEAFAGLSKEKKMRHVCKIWKGMDVGDKAKYVKMANEDKTRYEEECHKRDLEVEANRAARREENENIGQRKRKTSTRVSYSDKAHDRELDDACIDENAEIVSDSSDDDDDKLQIEQILAMDTLTPAKWAKRCVTMNTDWMNNGSAFDGGDIHSGDSQVTKFLIKWKDKSYLHVTWQSENELLKMCKGKHAVVRGYVNRFVSSGFRHVAAPYFPEDFVTAERIIKIERNGKVLTKRPDWWDDSGKDYKNMEPVALLVKWASLGYYESTEEFVGDIENKSLIEEYFKREDWDKMGRGTKPKRSVKHFQTWDNDNLNLSEGLHCRDYQLEGINWLVFNWHNRRNSLLADEMGLGKTITSSCFIKALQQNNVAGPFLVIAPLSTLQHWQREVEKWTQLNAIVFQGSAKDREVIREHEFMYAGKPWKRTTKNSTHQNMCKFDVLIASYETCLNEDFDDLMDMKVECFHALRPKSAVLSL